MAITSDAPRYSRLCQELFSNQLVMVEAAGKTEDRTIAGLCYQTARERNRLAEMIATLSPKLRADPQNLPCSARTLELSDALRSALSERGSADKLLSFLVRCECDLLFDYKAAIANAANARDTELLDEHMVKIERSLRKFIMLRDRKMRPDLRGTLDLNSLSPPDYSSEFIT